MAKDITFKRLLTYWPLYFFVLPSALMVATFSYFPAANAIYRSTYRWNGNYISVFVGTSNFQKALGSPMLWVVTLILSMVMIFHSQKETRLATALKWICGLGFPAVILAVLFPDMVEDLAPTSRKLWEAGVWAVLYAVIMWRLENDNDSRGVIGFVSGLFAGSSLFAGAGLSGLMAWSASTLLMGVLLWIPCGLFSRTTPMLKGMRISHALLGMGMMVWALALHAGGDAALWSGFSVIAVLVVANIVKMIPSIATAVVVNRLKSDAANYWYRVLFVVPMIIPGMVYLLIWKFFFNSDGLFNLLLRKTGIMHLLYLFDARLQRGVFLDAAEAAELSLQQIMELASSATPTWLGSEELVLPAFIIWGFPWVGVVGVLIYLAGLQSIDSSVYEAADLDGVGPFGKFLNIELPLILTQVRINLVLMIIGTLQMYGMILVLYGVEGGPNGRMMVPGLLMFRSAFVEGYAGYACAIGLILFFLILILTEINNRFVRVEK
jgi:raffinose/stachyose/melibiose transport system permease protein